MNQLTSYIQSATQLYLSMRQRDGYGITPERATKEIVAIAKLLKQETETQEQEEVSILGGK